MRHAQLRVLSLPTPRASHPFDSDIFMTTLSTTSATPAAPALSLGERLAQSAAAEAARERASRDAAERARRVKQEHEHQQVRTFFAQAREFFTTSILEGKAPKDLRVPMGADVRQGGRVLQMRTNELYQLLQGYKSSSMPAGLSPGAPFSNHWEKFLHWAGANDLEASWQNEHDGVGISSWWVLQVLPNAAASASAPSVA